MCQDLRKVRAWAHDELLYEHAGFSIVEAFQLMTRTQAVPPLANHVF
jgi:hypothetical protein